MKGGAVLAPEEWRALGLRAVACAGWRWMQGMAKACTHEDPKESFVCTLLWRQAEQMNEPGALDPTQEHPPGDPGGCPSAAFIMGPRYTMWPDFRNPATLGCLIALVREAWSDDVLSPSFDPDFDGWVVSTSRPCAPCAYDDDGRVIGPLITEYRFEALTESGALVAALEAAPTKSTATLDVQSCAHNFMTEVTWT